YRNGTFGGTFRQSLGRLSAGLPIGHLPAFTGDRTGSNASAQQPAISTARGYISGLATLEQGWPATIEERPISGRPTPTNWHEPARARLDGHRVAYLSDIAPWSSAQRRRRLRRIQADRELQLRLSSSITAAVCPHPALTT